MQTDNSMRPMKVADLIPYENNSRIHTDQQISQLANSIEQWGFTIPILIDEANMILAGHGRLLAAKQLGIEEVPCVMADGWTEEQKRAYIIADNKLAENSSWDTDLYFSELKELSSLGFDLSLAGFDSDLNFSFKPNLSPNTEYAEVTDGDIEKANKSIYEQFVGAGTKPHKDALDVICPECGEEFTVSGY